MSGDGGISLRAILQKHEEQLIDISEHICLLCKRKFINDDQLKRHRSLSELHESRLKKLRKRLFTDEQLEKIERKEREALYRDRAKERRQKFGDADKLIKITNHYATDRRPIIGKATHVSQDTSSSNPLGKDNKGASLLSKMGWREGTGLGKSNQGMTEAIQLKAQVGTSGLGSKQQQKYKVDPKASYQEAVRQIMYQRYKELESDEDDKK